MKSRVQELAEKINMSSDEFVGGMRRRGYSEPAALKLWRGEYENFDNFNDNDMNPSNLRKASFVLRIGTGALLPKREIKTAVHRQPLPWLGFYIGLSQRCQKP